MAERAMFTVGSNFHPFSMEEMLVPFQLYKDAYEKTENAYTDLADKADKFKYLADTLPEGSKAREIYEGYANGLSQQAEDLAHNGLSQANRRALTSYKRRYQGEIGRLDKADTALQEEIKRRQTLDANDSSRLYAKDTINLNIDDFLDGSRPNDYSVSGNDLYKRGLEIGTSGSSRIYSSPTVSNLTKAYQDIIQTQGYSPELIAKFRQDLASIPEFQQAIESTLKEKGVTQNLTGDNLARARESVINGVVNGITFKRSDNVQQNPDYITAYQQKQLAQAQDSLKLQAAGAGMKKGKNGNWVWDENIDPSFQKAKAVAKLKADGKSSGTSGTTHNTIAKQATRIEWNGNNPNDDNGDADDDYTINTYTPGSDGSDNEHKGTLTDYDNLPTYAKKKADQIIKDGNYDYYDIYFRPYKSGTFDDDEALLDIVPRNIVTDDSDDEYNMFSTVGKK